MSRNTIGVKKDQSVVVNCEEIGTPNPVGNVKQTIVNSHVSGVRSLTLRVFIGTSKIMARSPEIRLGSWVKLDNSLCMGRSSEFLKREFRVDDIHIVSSCNEEESIEYIDLHLTGF